MDLLNQLLEQVSALGSVWVPVVLFVAIVGVLIWQFLNHHYAGRIDSKNDLIALRDAQLQDYKDKLSGATPDEARARIEALEAIVAPLKPRRLSSEQIEQISDRLRANPGSMAITQDAGSPDAAVYAADFAEAARKANWGVTQMTAIGSQMPTAAGLVVFRNEKTAATAEPVIQALKEAGVEVDIFDEPADNPYPKIIVELAVTNRFIR